MNAVVSPLPPYNLHELDAWLDERLEAKLQEREAARTPRLTLITTKGTLDMAYPPFILASTAASLDWEVEIFFSFYALNLLKKDLDLGISPLGNPAMPMKLPVGPAWLRGIDWSMPNLLMAGIPGFEGAATAMMKKTLSDKGVASIAELRGLCIEAGVKLSACQMTVDLFGWQRDDFIPEISEWLGATSVLPKAQQSDVCLFI
ncbi:peroxiredoxin family protein [Sulfuritortus calidifontis]|uniref:Peroxiredoxin family protein n=1 Tax=Sulfuritortus calidifontis TaxID=1914471 RepID=A0A4R3JUT3_9PROT|nr:DsrE/DsrF/DrsH-like family protein [Sulfuritortus calidifontis]TCS69707.1 peroxiredoxin family protein [Sulfuritortus calidifontis]